MSTDDAHLRERGLTREIVFKGVLLSIRLDTVALPNGEIANREIVEHPGAVAIVAVEDGQVLLVRQYRHAVGDISLELPAGCLDKPGEEVAVAAARELREETGRSAATLAYLGQFHASPGFTNETTHLFAAEGLTNVGGSPDDDEFLEVVKVPLAEALAMARRGSIRDAKTIAGLLWYQAWGTVSLQAPPPRGTVADD
jgi:ADP-ribose pyrophosphatase